MAISVLGIVPRCDLDLWNVRIGPVAAALFVMLSGCADGTAGVRCTEPPCDEVIDGGPRSDGGGAARDASARRDSGPMPGAIEDPFAGGCFNGLDDDANGLTDCAETSCGASAYCCVGSMSAACCGGNEPVVDRVFSTCDEGDAIHCFGVGASAFGGPSPRIEGGAFVPNGDELSDSGLVIGPLIDPSTHRLVLSATIAAVPEGCVDADPCLDVLGLGFGDVPSGIGRVEPDIAFLVRASRNDYAILIAGEVVQASPLPSSSAVYRIEVTPSGEATFSVEGAVVLTTGYLPRPGRAPLLYGRTHNRTSGSEPARALDVSVSHAACEVIDVWDRASVPALPPTVGWGSAMPKGPSVIDLPGSGSGPVAAFEIDGSLYLARQQVGGAWALLGAGDVASPILRAPLGERYQDPELRVVDDDRFELFFTRVSASGSSIARALGEPGLGEVFGAVEDVLLPSLPGGFRSPSVLSYAETEWLAAVTRFEGQDVIVMLRETELGYAFADRDVTSSIVARPADGFAHFDDDEVGDPDLVLDNDDLMRLYYAGRRGSRFSIGMRVSANGVQFRDPLEGRPVLEPGGVQHDILSVRAPSVRFTNADVELYYEAYDGLRTSIGHAQGVAP